MTRGFLGVSIQDVTRDIADSVGLKQAKGAVVGEATKDSPADRAGIKSGDIITAVGGQTVDDARTLSRRIGEKSPGTTVEITIWRDGAEQKLSVTLEKLTTAATDKSSGPSSSDQPAVPTPSSVGITVVPNSDGPGLLIQDIDPNSVAATKGFSVGDTILEVDNKAVGTAKQFQDAIDAVKASGRPTALIKAEHGGNVLFVGPPLSDK